jgi:hypothetical protein
VSLGGHDFDSVWLGISADLAFPRASVCSYLDRPNWFALTRNSLSRTITILRCCNELPVANFNFQCATSRVHVPVIRQSRGRYLLVFAAIGALKPQLARERPSLVWKARRNIGWKRLLNERNTARHVLRIIAKRDTDGIFFPGNLSLQVGNLSSRHNWSTETHSRLAKTIGPGAGAHAIPVQALLACAAQSLLERVPVEP